MEEGIANLFLVSRATSKLKAKIEKRIPKKKGIAAAVGAVEKQKGKFYEQIIQALIIHFTESAAWQTQLKCVIIASPGFTREAFYNYLRNSAEAHSSSKGSNSGFLKHCLDRAIVAHSTSGFKHSLQEVLSNKAVQEKIKDLAVFEESASLDKFFEALAIDQDRVCYGQKSVAYAL